MTYSNDDFTIGSMAVVSLNGSNKTYNAMKHSDNAWYLLGAGFYGASWVVIHDRLITINPSTPISEEWVDVFWEAYANQAAPVGSVSAGLAALFAHIAAPPEPKPEEPTGDRATVRDRDGVLWTRDEEPVVKGYRWVDVSAGRGAAWSDLDVPADGVLWGGVE